MPMQVHRFAFLSRQKDVVYHVSRNEGIKSPSAYVTITTLLLMSSSPFPPAYVIAKPLTSDLLADAIFSFSPLV